MSISFFRVFPSVSIDKSFGVSADDGALSSSPLSQSARQGRDARLSRYGKRAQLLNSVMPFSGLPIFALILTAVPNPTLADCVFGDDTHTCSGAVETQTFDTGTKLTIEGLTTDIIPLKERPPEAAETLHMQIYSNGSDGVEGGGDLPNGTSGGSAEALTFTFEGKKFGLVGNNITLVPNTNVGLIATSNGGNGGEGADESSGDSSLTGGNGGAGGNGLDVTSTFKSGTIDLSLNRTESDGEFQMISAVSNGGGGGDGGHGDVDFLADHARGGAGNNGGNSGNTSVTMTSGTLNFFDDGFLEVPVYGVLSKSQAGAGGTGGHGDITTGDSTGGNSGFGGDAGTASVMINSGSIELNSINGSAVAAVSSGGDGAKAGEGHTFGVGSSRGGTAADGGASQEASVVLGKGDITITSLNGAGGVLVLSEGGSGGLGGDADTDGDGNGDAIIGGAGGDGGSSGTASLTLEAATITVGSATSAVIVKSQGGQGGVGGKTFLTAGIASDGGQGGRGGDAGSVIVKSTGNGPAIITTQSTTDVQHGIIMQSVAGNGGTGGYAGGAGDIKSKGGDGGQGGTAGSVQADIWAKTTTHSVESQAIFARSYGGAGGAGGGTFSGIGEGKGGTGAGAGPAGDVTVTYRGTVDTHGHSSTGVLLQSVGGFSGDGGDASGFIAYGASSQSAGKGGTVDLTLVKDTTITTYGEHSYGVQLQSIGGGGGRGGEASGIGALGGQGSSGGDGGTVTLNIDAGATISTNSSHASAVHAMSVGGGGGDGGGSIGVASLGGSGGTGGAGGTVTVSNAGTLSTKDKISNALYAASIGGGGGSAYSVAGMAALGGAGGGGGTGGVVTINNSGAITTEEEHASAVIGHSIGGGGGHGAYASAVGPAFSMAIGGSGGPGNFANSVTYNDTGGARTISTQGNHSRGVFLQSVGGGGGDGGGALATAMPEASLGFAFTLGRSGYGRDGGDGGQVQYLNGKADVSTSGDHAAAIHVQSIGGGGGNAGNAITFTTVAAAAASVTLGGSGGGGGSGQYVEIESDGEISTDGAHSTAVFAQSIGGGGGNAGNSFSGNIAAGVSSPMTFGGKGDRAGNGGVVYVQGGGGIITKGLLSTGIHLQSIGGGGGNGGSTASASGINGATSVVTVGSGGGGGGNGDRVQLDWADSITTSGDHSSGVMAQSIGGGGGNAGNSVAGALANQVSVTSTVGGAGGLGGDAGEAIIALTGQVITSGDIAPGVVAQSIGGGGGHSGVSVAGTLTSDTAISTTVGGGGGLGGHAADVNVTVAGIMTDGNSSAGVNAQSIGGGGGASHFSGAFSGLSQQEVSTDIGGSGAKGGNSGDVTVLANGDVQTFGHNSTGIKALSVGGGGGDSGTSVAGDLQAAEGVNLTVGGKGAAGGEAGTVTLTTADKSTITTWGSLSEGIHASSIGGGGGSAGYAVSGSGVGAAQINVALGGDGGKAGNSEDVNVHSNSSIFTKGEYSTAIEARSVAGGGGSSKGSISASALTMGSANVALGGDGGAGGKAGKVTVESFGEYVETLGHNASFIVAQSIGGAGGTGGIAAVGGFNAGEVTGNVSVALGGKGGTGGTADAVVVTSYSDAFTSDYGSFGILAQSIGGAGGEGGSVYSGNLSVSSSASVGVTVNVGGEGGGGGLASTVNVNHYGSISTDGYFADGVLAQSIGGNGGNGGSVYSVAAQVERGSSANLTVDIGGKGGDGKKAQDVTIVNYAGAQVMTAKGGSDALAAMSVGGGGGKGGSAGSITLSPDPTGGSSGASFTGNFNVTIGGDGGTGGDANKVTVTNEGALTTKGKVSRGIYAASIGGGGGSGGIASAVTYSFDGVCNLIEKAKYSCKTEKGDDLDVDVSAKVTIGGFGNAAGDGDEVNVVNTGSISTENDNGHGIVAHSIGGGGGEGGEGTQGLEAWTTNEIADSIGNLPADADIIPTAEFDVTVGGYGGASGDGGIVTVSGAGTITTKGKHAYGVRAQSIGGGGGNGGAGAGGYWTAGTVGGQGSGGGIGRDVTVEQGAIITSGDGSVGIFAQSVGGGGGTAGDIEEAISDSWLDLNIGAGVGVQLSSGSGGNGGKVTVTASSITTTGSRAHGIFAQSVGGSGGVAGIPGKNSSSVSFVGGNGDPGDGGAVEITTNGAISVSGEYAHGIFAQSSAGQNNVNFSDSSGDVTIDVNADISATGENGRAILAQSQGASNETSGTIAITVAEGATVITAANGAETIGFFNGQGNTLTNNGVIRHEGTDVDSYVIRANGNALNVQNNGVIEGSVLNLGVISLGEAVSFVNASKATFGLGGTVNLGLGGTLNNAGLISAGTVGEIGSSEISGALIQADTGAIHVDYKTTGGNDVLNFVAGPTPNLAGTVNPLLQGTSPTSGTNGSFVFLSSVGGIASNTLTVANTATVDYGLSQDAGDISLEYNVDYAPWTGSPTAQSKVSDAARALITENHTRFAYHFDDLVGLRATALNAGSDDYAFVDDLSYYLLGVSEVADLVNVYDSYAPTEVFAPSETALFSSLRFSDNLRSCPAQGADGLAVFRREGSCVWSRIGGVASSKEAGNSSDYDENVFSFSTGIQNQTDSGWFAGVAIGYERSRLSSLKVSGDGDRFNIGAVAKREFGATTLSVSLQAGMSDFDLDRQVITPAGTVTASSKPKATWLASHARIAHAFDLSATTYLKPWADIGIQRTWQDGYSETGAGAYGLNVGSSSNTIGSLNLMLELGTNFDFGGMATEATISGGGLFLFGDTERSTTAHLIGSGLGGPGFTITDNSQNKFASFNAQIKTQISKRASLAANFGALYSDDQFQYGASLKLFMPF